MSENRWTATAANGVVHLTHPERSQLSTFAGYDGLAESLAKQVNDGAEADALRAEVERLRATCQAIFAPLELRDPNATGTAADREMLHNVASWFDVYDAGRGVVGRDGVQRDLRRIADSLPDSDAPHPLAYRVEDTDGRPTWELPGRFVRELDPNEWEAHITTAITGSPFQVVSQNASPFHVYRVRRVAPPEPQMALRTVPVGTVELGSLTPSGKPIDGVERSKRFPYGAILVDGQWHPTVNGTVTIQANGGES